MTTEKQNARKQSKGDTRSSDKRTKTQTTPVSKSFGAAEFEILSAKRIADDKQSHQSTGFNFCIV